MGEHRADTWCGLFYLKVQCETFKEIYGQKLNIICRVMFLFVYSNLKIRIIVFLLAVNEPFISTVDQIVQTKHQL